MHRAILCIGSNVKKARQLIEQAVECLSERGTNVAMRSDVYSVSLPYYNCVAMISTELKQCALIALTKEIEAEMGRTKAMKASSHVPIDIDVVVFDDVTLRPSDYSSDYFKQGYSRLENITVDMSENF